MTFSSNLDLNVNEAIEEIKGLDEEDKLYSTKEDNILNKYAELSNIDFETFKHFVYLNFNM